MLLSQSFFFLFSVAARTNSITPAAEESKAGITGPPPAKLAKRESMSTEPNDADDAASPENSVHQLWHPLIRMWTWTQMDGHQMVSIKFCPTAGMSPGSTDGIDIHAVGATCSIVADWPKEFWEELYIRKYYSKEELQDPNAVRMLDAEQDSLRKLVVYEDSKPRAPVDIPLPFAVMETRNTPLKVVNISKTGSRMVTFSLASTVVPSFAKKKVHQDQTFDD